jgi:uncharacterized Zn finger protein (UPF0148 family)
MKKKNCKCAKAKAAEMEIIVEQEPKEWVVNCPKCGASLNLKDGGTAYLCPVCSTLLRVKTGARLVKNLNVADKTLRVNITEQAVNYLLETEAKRAKKSKCIFRRKRKPTLESMLARRVIKEGYTVEDSILVELGEKGLRTKKVENKPEETV